MADNKSRHTVWLSDETWNEVVSHYKADNCSTQNEFIEKAVRFYSGYLDTDHADAYLPRVLSDVLDGKLGTLGDRLGRLLFRLTVEESMMLHVLAAAVEVRIDDLRKLRAQCVQDTKKTNGIIRLEEAVAEQKGVE